ncbi:MAG TPA: DUF4388 domain-containing protein [Polyangiaceae bacterium]|nr:DUF4388 domain-containing protein [Polyangiaceae bacterium]
MMGAAVRGLDELESGTIEAGFSGFVHGVALVDLLQIFHYSRRSLTLHVEPNGAIHMREGEVVDAKVGDIEGDLAISCLLERTGGRIRTTTLESQRSIIQRPFNFLLLDALRDLDESSREPTESWGGDLAAEAAVMPRITRLPSVPVGGSELLLAACMQLAERIEDARAVALYDRRERKLVVAHGQLERSALEAQCVAAFERPALEELGARLHAFVDAPARKGDWDEVRYVGSRGLMFGKSLTTRPWALVICAASPESPGLAWTELRQSALMIEKILA